MSDWPNGGKQLGAGDLVGEQDGQNCLDSQRKIWSKLWKSSFHLLPSSHQDYWPMDLPTWSYLFPLASGSASQKVHPHDKMGMHRSDTAFLLALVWGTLQIFLLACPLCKWANPEPRHLKLCLCKALKEPVQALRIGRRAQLESRTAGRWDIHSCACHT